VVNTFVIAGMFDPNAGFIMLTLAPWEKRARSQQEIAAELRPKLQAIPGVEVNLRQANSLGIRGGGQGLGFAITGTEYEELASTAEEMQAALEELPVFDRVTLDYNTTQPELAIAIDREVASDLGVSVEAIGTTLATLLDGREMGEYYVEGDAIPVRAQAPTGRWTTPATWRASTSVRARTAWCRCRPSSP
jgi:HAE1 family hydrophobic/amphiphilic exporter-1